jgi:type 1 fimbria pilin
MGNRTLAGRSVGMLLFMMALAGHAAAENGGLKVTSDNLKFDGTLVADPCELDPNTTDITLDFGTVIDTYLYLNTRTHAQPFALRLLECDLSLGNQVEVTFKGTQSKELPGFLALSNSAASGIALGLEQKDGTPLPLNKTVPAFTLAGGTNDLVLYGYVIGEPSALAAHTLRRGAFEALATFELNYP